MRLATTDVFKKLYAKKTDLIVLTDDELLSLQEVLLKMASDIVDIMESNHMTYHLTGGSALGAVRHQGFIPWDDDMDFDIARKDVKKFIEKFNDKYSDKYWIYSPYDSERCLPFIQIRLKNTRYVGINDFASKDCGVPIDIAIMENTYNNAILRKLHGFGSMFLGLIVSCRKFAKYHKEYLQMVEGFDEEQKIFRKKIWIGRLFSFFSLERWIFFYDRWNQKCKNENSKYVVVPTGRKHYFKETYERSKFYEVTKMKFVNHDWNVPKDYDYYLSKMYGDYMVIPKADEIERHALLEFKLR